MVLQNYTRRRVLQATGTMIPAALAGCAGSKVLSNQFETDITNLWSENSGDHDYYYAQGYAANQTSKTFTTVSAHIAFFKENDERIEVVESEEVYDLAPDERIEFTVGSGPYDEYMTIEHPEYVEIHHVETSE